MDGVVAYVLSKKYTKDTAIGMGAVKGAPCQVESINKVGKTTTVTLKWEDDLGVSHTQSFDIEDGLDGISVTGATINSVGHLILTFSNSTTIDCGNVLPQYDTMPTPSSTYLGAIYQYIGDTNVNYTNGYFYKCVSDGSGGYIWTQYNVQPTPVTSVNGETGDVVLDASDVNAQEIIQYNIMPIADASNVNKVYQYIGTTNLTYTNGYFYRCEYDSDNDTYNWVVANQFALADDVYTKTEIGSLSDLPDTSKNIVENIADLNTFVNDKLDEKENIFRFETLPTATADKVGKVVQYIGNNAIGLTNGYYYQCIEISEGVYNWVQKNVQPSGGGTGGDGVIEGYFNPTNHLFYEDSTFINPINGESDTLYISLDTNLLYRYDSDNSIFIRVDEGGQSIQVTIMPLADEYQLNKIYQYVGTTDSIYTNGYFYKCIYDGSDYKWILINVQDSYTKEEIGSLNNLPDNTEDVVENIVNIKLSIDQLIASQLTLGNLSTNAYYGDKGKTAYDHSQITNGSNPHNTKANNVNLNSNITVDGNVKTQVEETLNAINTLAASNKSNKADKVDNATDGNFAGLDTNGNLTDSGKKASDFVATSDLDGIYTVNDTPETNIDDNDYFPYLDVSAGTSGEKRKTLWSNIKSVLETYFNTLYSTVKTSKAASSGGTDLSLVTTGEKYIWDEKVGKSSTAGLLKNDGTVDTTSYATTTAMNTALATKANLTDLAPVFDENTLYPINSYVIYDNNLYRFTTRHTAGAWTGNDVTRITIGDDLSDKYFTTLDPTISSGYVISDSTDSFSFYLGASSNNGKCRITWGNLKAKLKAYFDTLYTGALQWNDL